MAHNERNRYIEKEISDRISEMRVEVVSFENLSMTNPIICQSSPLLTYLFIQSQQPCFGYVGTSSSLACVRLTSQRRLRSPFNFVVFLPLPLGIGYDVDFSLEVEHTTMKLVKQNFQWFFLENVRIYNYRFDELVHHCAMLLINKVNFLVPENIKRRKLNSLFDRSTHRVLDTRGHDVGGLVLDRRGATILRDCAIFQEPFFYDPHRHQSPKPEMNPMYDRLQKEGFLYEPGPARGRHPLLVRLPITLPTIDDASHFISGNSSIKPLIFRNRKAEAVRLRNSKA